MPPDDGPSVGELSRRMTDVFSRFEGLARRLEDGQFVRTDLYNQYKAALDSALLELQRRVSKIENDKLDQDDKHNFDSRIGQLEDDKKWLIRLIIGFIVLAVLGLIFVTNGGGGGGGK